MVLVRLDAGPTIGAGHVMRCLSIVKEINSKGSQAAFVVSDEESASLTRSLDIETHVLGGCPTKLIEEDGIRFGELCRSLHASSILVDTYAVTDSFFYGLRSLTAGSFPIAYIDDLYTFADGKMVSPKAWNVDAIINYGMAFSDSDYNGVYGDGVELFIGPKYAPVRPEFKNHGFIVNQDIHKVLITSGSTNPNRCLERMVDGLKLSGISNKISVTVGRRASFDSSCCEGLSAEVLHDVKDMASQMAMSDLVITAAGSTIYELCVMGVPFVAIPIVDNQLLNAAGVQSLGVGVSTAEVDCDKRDIAKRIMMLSKHETRERVSKRAQSVVDGLGASRLAHALLDSLR